MQRRKPSQFESQTVHPVFPPKILFFVVFLISLFCQRCTTATILLSYSPVMPRETCSSQDRLLSMREERTKIKCHDVAHRRHHAPSNPPKRLTECVPSHEVHSSNVDLSTGCHIPHALCRGTVHVIRRNCSPQMQTEGNAIRVKSLERLESQKQSTFPFLSSRTSWLCQPPSRYVYRG